MSIFVALFLSVVSSASFLQIQGNGSLSIANGGMLSGTYELKNLGDEPAREVGIQVLIHNWDWRSNTRALEAGEASLLAVAQNVPESDLKCSLLKNCDGALPSVGQVPVLVKKHYQDQNGYAFSSPEVLVLPIGISAAEEEKLPLPFTLNVATEGDGKNFDLRYRLQNLTEQEIQIHTNVVLPDEALPSSQALPLRLAPRAELSGQFHFVNVRGLPGSQYVSTLVLQWEQSGQRRAHWQASAYDVREPFQVDWFSREMLVWIIAALFVVGAAALIVGVHWPLRRAKKITESAQN